MLICISYWYSYIPYWLFPIPSWAGSGPVPCAGPSLRGPLDGRPPGPSDGRPRGPRTRGGRVGPDPGPGPAHEGIDSYSAQEGINSKGNIIKYRTLFNIYIYIYIHIYIYLYINYLALAIDPFSG